jgi:2-phosphosulfolactate phosphatase
METTFEVSFTPADFEALGRRDLSKSVCVVFDVLRATSSMLAALEQGAKKIYPVTEISEALALRKKHPTALLAGEREGLRIRKGQTGGTDFDLGNSPREFTAAKVSGKTIIMTTTNGTRALQACAKAAEVLIGSFANITALARWIDKRAPQSLFVVCAGTFEEAAYEDTIAAGSLADLLSIKFNHVADSVRIAREAVRATYGDIHLSVERHSRNARRLLSRPELRDDVNFCLRRDVISFNAGVVDGAIERLA